MEVYRGIAAVIIGGMTFSALFSLSFMSALLSLPIFNHKPATDHSVGLRDLELGVKVPT